MPHDSIAADFERLFPSHPPPPEVVNVRTLDETWRRVRLADLQSFILTYEGRAFGDELVRRLKNEPGGPTLLRVLRYLDPDFWFLGPPARYAGISRFYEIDRADAFGLLTACKYDPSSYRQLFPVPAATQARRYRGGRPRNTDWAEDRRIDDAWKTGQHATLEDFANAFGKTREEVIRARNRHRKRVGKPLPLIARQ